MKRLGYRPAPTNSRQAKKYGTTGGFGGWGNKRGTKKVNYVKKAVQRIRKEGRILPR